MLTAVVVVILCLIGLCVLPFVAALVWAVAPYVLTFAGFALFATGAMNHEYGVAILGFAITAAGGLWFHLRHPDAAY